MTSFSEQCPLPGQVDPRIMPCAFCRRRLRVNGQPVFQTCVCKAMGPSVTIASLAVGAGLLLAGLWLLLRRTEKREAAV